MVKLYEVFVIVAYTNNGQVIATQDFFMYPTFQEIEQFANGYQQSDYLKVEKQYRFVGR